MFLLRSSVPQIAFKKSRFPGQERLRCSVVASVMSGRLKHFDPVALCNKPGSPDICLGKLGAHDRQFGARLHIVKPDEYFSLYDEVSFFHSDLTDDPAVAVLNSLEVLVDIDGAGGDHSTGKLRRRRPTASDSDQQEAERAAGSTRPPRRKPLSPSSSIVSKSLADLVLFLSLRIPAPRCPRSVTSGCCGRCQPPARRGRRRC